VRSTRRKIPLAHYTLRILLLVLLFVVLVVVLLSALLRFGSPLIGRYQAEIQGVVSDYLGTPVELGEMNFDWGPTNPRITIDDVRIPDKDGSGESAIQFKQVWLDLNLPKTLFYSGWHINDVAVVGADLELEYHGKQDFRVKGLPFADTSADTPDDESRVADDTTIKKNTPLNWLLRTRQAALLDSGLTLHDFVRGETYRIESIDITAENDGEDHRLRADLQLPEGFGQQLELEIDLKADTRGGVIDLAQTAGNISMSSQGVQVENWLQLVPDRHIDLAGIADLELKAQWSGEKLNDVALQLRSPMVDLLRPGISEGSEPEEDTRLESLEADLQWLRNDNGWTAIVEGLAFSYLGQANDLRDTEIKVARVSGQRLWRASTSGKRIDLAALTVLLSHAQPFLPMGGWPEKLTEADPKGLFSDWGIVVDRGVDSGSLDGFPAITLRGELTDFKTSDQGELPEISGLTASFDIENNRGSINVSGDDVFFRHADSYSIPLQLQSVQAVVDVEINDSVMSISSNELTVRDRGLEASAAFVLDFGDSTPKLKLNTEYSLDNGVGVTRYIPRGVVPQGVTSWLDRAILAGSISEGIATFDGRISDFPFDNTPGIFEASMKVSGAGLDYFDEWPVVERADGVLSFSKDSLNFDLDRGYYAGLLVQSAKGYIKSLRRPIVRVRADTRDKLTSLVSALDRTPLDNISAAIADTEPTGEGTLELVVTVPILAEVRRQADEVFNVDGSLAFERNRLISELYKTSLHEVTGKLKFSHEGFNPSQLEAEFLGQPMIIEAHSSGRGSKRLSELVFAGADQPRLIASAYKIPVVTQLRGSSSWYLNVEIPHDAAVRQERGILVTGTSDLKGTAIDMPPPLAKKSGSRRRLLVSTAIRPGEPRLWNVRLGNDVSALIRVAADGDSVDQMLVHFGNRPASPKDMREGFRFTGTPAQLPFDQWFDSFNAILGEIDDFSTDDSGSENALLPPVSANLKTPKLRAGNTFHGPASVIVNSDGRYINAVFENRAVRGSVRVPRTEGPYLIRIANLDKSMIDSLGDPPFEQAERQGEKALPDPREVPPLNIHLAQVQWDRILVRDLVIRTEPDRAGLAVTTFGFAQDDVQLSGEGFWHWVDPQSVNPLLKDSQVSGLDLQLRTGNAGRALKRFGLGGTMAEGRGTIDIAVGWSGQIYKVSRDTVDGILDLKLQRGRLLNVDPGPARIIGLFSLQSIPRRLSLDFSDLVDDGLNYDSISGRMRLSEGVASTELLQLRGPIGVIDITGTSDLVAQTYDQKIVVLPSLSGALPLIGVISGGATAGIGALLAGPILQGLGIDLDRLGLRTYTLKGDWATPEIKQVAN